MGRAALALFLRFAAKEQANSKKNFEHFSKISNGGGGGIANGKLYKGNRGNPTEKKIQILTI